MSIITLTLNPAIDVHCNCGSFAAGKENFGDITQRLSSGKGVNISRALTETGIPNKAFIVVGNENRAEFLDDLKNSMDAILTFDVPGRIRENFTIHAENNETRLSFSGFSVDDNLLANLKKAILDSVEVGDYITITGSLPKGISAKDIKPTINELKEKGVFVVIDSRSFSLSDLTEIKPWLIKPNEQEISQYLSKNITSLEEIIPEAQNLYRSGISNVMVSMGAEGALLICNEGGFIARPPEIKAVSTIGAGDSSIAGFLTGTTSEERLRAAIAFGTAACLAEGTLPPKKSDVDTIYTQVGITRLF